MDCERGFAGRFTGARATMVRGIAVFLGVCALLVFGVASSQAAIDVRLASGPVVLSGSGDVQPPTVPGALAALPGSGAPVVATLSWTPSIDDVGVAGYRIWRASAGVGPYHAIAESPAPVFTDTTGLVGEAYWYRVSAFDAAGNHSALSDPAGPVVAEWGTATPHAAYSSATDLCRGCHALHVAAGPKLARASEHAENPSAGVCYECHDGTVAATDILGGSRNSFELASGHELEGAGGDGADLTVACGSCHGAHRDYLTNRMLPRSEINGQPVTGADTTWCLACHNDTNDWYGEGYPALAAPVRDGSGYPVLGRFPGASVYADTASNAHAAIPVSAAMPRRAEGDCLYCHEAHRSASEHDALSARYTMPTAATLAADQATGEFAALCFGCHGSRGTDAFPFSAPDGAADIERFVTADAPGAGHRIKTAGGTLPAGAPMPCYNCHNPHGSSRGNASLISDERGQGLSTATPAGVRAFCFTCHSSSDATPRVWDSVAGVYVPVGADSVEGLRRDGSYPAGTVLRLPPISGHAAGDTQDCYGCHGDDYSSAGANNVHNPGLGGEASRESHTATSAASLGECGSCHKDTRDNDEGGIWIEQIHASCAQCHPTPVDLAALPSGLTPECASCHTVLEGEEHVETTTGFATAHTATVEESCTEFCHTADIVSMHRPYVALVNEAVPWPALQYSSSGVDIQANEVSNNSSTDYLVRRGTAQQGGVLTIDVTDVATLRITTTLRTSNSNDAARMRVVLGGTVVGTSPSQTISGGTVLVDRTTTSTSYVTDTVVVDLASMFPRPTGTQNIYLTLARGGTRTALNNRLTIERSFQPPKPVQYTACELCHENATFGTAAGLPGGRLRDTARKPWTAADGDISLRPGARSAWTPVPPEGGHVRDCATCHVDAHGIAGHGGSVPDLTDLHVANVTGTVRGTTYTDGKNVGCFAGCHAANLLFEHLDADFDSEWSASILGRTFSGTGENCGRCHRDQAEHLGAVGDTAHLPAVKAALASRDRRCEACHNGITTVGHPQRGLPAPHSSGAVLNTAAFGNYTGPAPLGTTTEFQDWPGGGGHNSMGTNWPKETWVGTFNGITNPALPYNSLFKGSWGKGSRVLCSDCHVVGPANGPHGASVPYGIDSGPGYASAPGDWFKGTGPYDLNATGGLGPAPVGLCAKCHGNFNSGFHSGSNNNHTGAGNTTANSKYNLPGYSCVSCHVRIPHAWKRPRLMRRVSGGTIGGVPEDGPPYAFSATERPGVTAIRVRTSTSVLGQADCAENGCAAHSSSGPYWP